MPSYPLCAQVDSLGGSVGLVILIVLFALMVFVGIFALALCGLWRMRAKRVRRSVSLRGKYLGRSAPCATTSAELFATGTTCVCESTVIYSATRTIDYRERCSTFGM